MAMFRNMVTQWEQLANQHGSQFMARPEAAQAMHSVTSAGMQVQAAVQDAMAKVLTAANMPSKVEIAAIGERLSAIEATLARLEAASTSSRTDTAQPTRGRKPDAAR